jgi:hypothetical protein
MRLPYDMLAGLFDNLKGNAVGLRKFRGKHASSATGSGAFGVLVEIFQPSSRHVVVEVQRQRNKLVVTPVTAPPIPLTSYSAIGAEKLDKQSSE